MNKNLSEELFMVNYSDAYLGCAKLTIFISVFETYTLW